MELLNGNDSSEQLDGITDESKHESWRSSLCSKGSSHFLRYETLTTFTASTIKVDAVPPIITMPALIERKRDRHRLTQEEIEAFVSFVARETASPSQIGAMLMAIFLNGLDDTETAHLTRAMTASGTVLNWSMASRHASDGYDGGQFPGMYVVDKHSTGGVGDKISLILTPVLAACGLKVPMVSGRGLGHTGGTIDKLESIPGFNAKLSSAQIIDVVQRVGCCITGQAADMAPVDGVLYAIRDVTATVECAPLITASILSKKAAEGISHLLMDVKFGRGAFAPTLAAAEEQARLLISTGTALGMRVTAVFSEMDNPIGRRIGNALEVVEAIECLRGGAEDSAKQQPPSDVMELVMMQAAILLMGAQKCSSFDDALRMAAESVWSGRALRRFQEMLECQNVCSGTAARLCSPQLSLADATDVLPRAPHQSPIRAVTNGLLASIDSRAISTVLRPLGAGRLKPSDNINYHIGVEFLKLVGEQVQRGDTVLLLHHDCICKTSSIQECTALLHGVVVAIQAAIRIVPQNYGDTNEAMQGGEYDDAFLVQNILNKTLPKSAFANGSGSNEDLERLERRTTLKKRRRVVKIMAHA